MLGKATPETKKRQRKPEQRSVGALKGKFYGDRYSKSGKTKGRRIG
jgi:hypothetical protein